MADTVSTPSAGMSSRAYLALVAAVAAGCVLIWLPALRSSLSIDEAGTFWVIKDGLAKTLKRSLDFQGQSPVYYIVDWIALKLFGKSEIALRVPSLVAMLLALVPVHRIGKRLFDPETALLATAAFAGTTSVAFASADARPYALALLFACVATLKLIRWLDGHANKQLALYVAAMALTIYVHYLYAAVLIAHAVYAIVRKRDSGLSTRKLLGALGLVALACVPLLPQFLALMRRSSSLAWTGDPTLRQLVLAVRAPVLLFAVGATFFAVRKTRAAWAVAPALGLAIVAAFGGVRLLHTRIVAGIGGPRVASALAAIVVAVAAVVLVKTYGLAFFPKRELREDAHGLTLVLAWALIPPLATYAVSLATPVKIFSLRYFFSATPGVVLLGAWAIRAAAPRVLRAGAAALILATAAALMSFEHSPDDWRPAVATLNATVSSAGEPVLVSAGFIEANQVSWLTDPEKSQFVLSPLAFYPVRGKVIPMPFDPVHEAAGYVAQIARDMTAPEFLVLTNKLHVLPGILEKALAPKGYHAAVVARYGWLQITKFERA